MNRRWQWIQIVVTACGLVVHGVSAAPDVFKESFEYGDETKDIRQVGDPLYTSGSVVLEYRHDVNLTHPALEGEIGGSFFENFGTAGGRSASTTAPDYSLASMAAGDTIWYAALFRRNNAADAYVSFNATAGMATLKFGVNAANGVYVEYTRSDPHGVVTAASGHTAASDGSTYLLVMRATRGTNDGGDYPPYNSQIDLWFNPETSDLGAPDWSSEPSRWNRYADSAVFGSMQIQAGYGNFIDEIRVATTQAGLGFFVPRGTVVFIK